MFQLSKVDEMYPIAREWHKLNCYMEKPLCEETTSTAVTEETRCNRVDDSCC